MTNPLSEWLAKRGLLKGIQKRTTRKMSQDVSAKFALQIIEIGLA